MTLSNNRKSKSRKTIVVRVRRSSGYKGGSNYYHHADIICKSKSEALKAAKEGRVTNWRWIDSFDTASKSYQSFEVLYTVNPGESKNPRTPITKRQKAIIDKRLIKAPN